MMLTNKMSFFSLTAFVVCMLLGLSLYADMTYLEAINAAEDSIQSMKGKVAYDIALGKLKEIVESKASEAEKIKKIQQEFSLGDRVDSKEVQPANNPKTETALDETPDIAEKIPPKKIDWIERSQHGSKGNVTVYVNKKGIPYEVYVIGVAPISTTMVAVEAEEDAREEAEFSAKGAFAIWMHEHFAVKNERDKKTIVIRTNGVEQSETTTISKRHAEQAAEGMWRGMSVYYSDMGKKQKGRCTVVWRWSIKESEMARLVEILTRDSAQDTLNRKPDMKIREYEGFRQ